MTALPAGGVPGVADLDAIDARNDVVITGAADDLVQSTGRSPSVDDIATYLGLERDDVLRGLSVSAAARVGSLSAGSTDATSDTPLDRIGALATDDPGYEHAIESDIVERLLARLPERERQIVQLRFFEQLSQAEIAAAVGVSQMQVSRLLRASFERMRGWMNGDDDAGELD